MAIGAVGPNGVLAVKLAMMAQNGASEDATTQSLSMVDGDALEVLPKRKCALLRGVSLALTIPTLKIGDWGCGEISLKPTNFTGNVINSTPNL